MMDNFVQGFDPEIFSVDATIKNRRITRSQILKKIGCPHLKLRDYDGYFLWEYDTYPDEYDCTSTENNSYKHADQSIVVCRLNDMTLEQWVDDGKKFVQEVEMS
jgi:hypothetical protein|tara:strand:- start:3565 stop:3876 length:312 start_codon:yes stop_codon:yes gene_type:complete